MINAATTSGTAILIVMTFVSIVSAQSTDFWSGTGTSFYHFGSSWTDNSPATAFDDAVFNQSATYTARWNDASGDTESRSILVQNGNVTFLGSFTDVMHTVLNDAVVEDGSSLVIVEHDLNVGEGMSVSGLVKVEGSSVVKISEGVSVGPSVGDNANLEIRDGGAEFNVVNSTAIVGQFGNGNLFLENGADLNISGNLRVGFQGQGSALFQDSGTNLSVVPGTGLFGQIVIGGQQLSFVDFFDGSTGSANELFVVENGILGIIGPGSSVIVDQMDISGSGSAAFVNIFSGGQLFSGSDDAVIGSFAGTEGVVQLGDSGSLWAVDDPITVGRAGAGELIIENGASVQSLAGISRIGQHTSGSGTVTVSGSGSTLELFNLDVGLDGFGVFQVLDGGVADTTDGFIGLANANGTVEVSGSASQWNTNTIRLGGDLSITNGGTINSGVADIELGSVNIAGDQSIWTVNGTFTVDPGGSEVVVDGGTLEILNDYLSSGLFADVTVQFGGTLSVGGTLSNGSGLELRGNGNTILGDVVNDGFFTMPFGSAVIEGNLTSNNTSTIEGILTVNGNYLGQNGISGEGGSTILNGDYEVGSGPADISTHHWQEHNLGLSITSQTTIELSGTESSLYDRFIVDGDLGLAGTLNVQLLGSFEPQDGDEFLIAEAGTLIGTFAGLPENSIVATIGDVDLKISYSAGDGNDVALIAETGFLLGDINGDGQVNLLDVQPFIDLLASGDFLAAADINGDGEVNLLDVAGFVDLLAG